MEKRGDKEPADPDQEHPEQPGAERLPGESSSAQSLTSVLPWALAALKCFHAIPKAGPFLALS